MSLTFNEFQRELRNRGIEGPVAIMMTTMYEQIREQAEQIAALASNQLEIINSVSGFVELHEATQGRVTALDKRISGDVEGVDLSSVPLRDN